MVDSAVPAVMTALIMPKNGCSVADLQLTDTHAVPRYGTDAAAPTSLNPVLCKVHWAALQPADRFIMEVADPPEMFDMKLPHVLGMDFAGTVAEVPPGAGAGAGDGAGADTVFKVGDRVCGLTGLCKPGGGTLAQYCSVPADCLAKVPDDVPLAEAATLPCCALTAAAAVWEHLALDKERKSSNAGTTLLVYGAATCVGQFAIQLAKLAGATGAWSLLRVCDMLHALSAHILWLCQRPTSGPKIG